MKSVSKVFKMGGKTLKSQDSFGAPVSVNYKGEQTHKSIFGGMVTIMATLIILVFFVTRMDKMVNRDNPEYASYFLPVSRSFNNSLSIPELNG